MNTHFEAVNSDFGLIVISAPSGTGKSTLCTRLLHEKKDVLGLSISTTSRCPRGTELHGKEYFFISQDEFKKKIDEDAFAEWALVHGNYYGTEKKTLENFWREGRHVLLDIDVQGAAKLRQVYATKTLSIFLAPPNLQELERRLRGRGTETEEAIQKRMKNAEVELKRQNEFDQVIVNDDLELSYARLKDALHEFIIHLNLNSNHLKKNT